jgi:hypothetical protein
MMDPAEEIAEQLRRTFGPLPGTYPRLFIAAVRKAYPALTSYLSEPSTVPEQVARWQEPASCAIPSPENVQTYNPNSSDRRMNEDGAYNPNRD